jgi:hypothetical protein
VTEESVRGYPEPVEVFDESSEVGDVVGGTRGAGESAEWLRPDGVLVCEIGEGVSTGLCKGLGRLLTGAH